MIYLKKWQKKKAPDSVSGRPCSGAEPEKTPLYNDYSSYLKKRFGGKVHRIGIDAGFSCPNRDGTKGRGGCSFCDDKGSRARYADPSRSVSEQLATGIKTLKEAKSAEKFIAYFQAFSNTHASPSKLRGIYDAVLPFKDVVGISIGTRPDIVDDEKMALIASYSDRYDMWVEFGLQSMHDRTLALLNRRHTREDFTQAVRLTKAHAVSCAAHVILGLPGESASDMIETARFLNSTKVEGVKIHLLHILKGSPLEKEYAHGAVRILEQEEYVTIICDFIENLSPDIVIQRLTGQGSGKSHIAPAWALDKIDTINKIRAELTRRGTRQGSALGMAPSRHCEES
ncbi:MAG: TIGR01212 family radical SAM protein [Candidatus Omnitrophota bacterium]